MVATLEMDQASYYKIKKGERRAKHEQVFIIAELLEIDKDEFLNRWFAEQIIEVIGKKEPAESVDNCKTKCKIINKYRNSKY